MVRVALMGLGTVGGGVAELLAQHQEDIARRAGEGIEVAAALVRDPAKARALNGATPRLTTDPEEILGDKSISIVVEAMGGEEPALSLLKKALRRGKHVVTANKALLAEHGNAIFAAAQEQGVVVAFEAAVAGGIPIIKAIREGLAGNRIQWLAGIINGTSNYILTQMRAEAKDFPSALAEAQRLGYAEADPGLDIDGGDAAHKLTLLASIAFGIPVDFAHCHVEGIRNLDRVDVVYAEDLGYRIKLLGIAKRRADGVELRVHPTLIPERHLLASVEGPFNAVLVDGDAVGQTLYYGRGAGAEPTASAIVADLVDVARTLTADPSNRVPHLAFQPDCMSALPLLPMAAVESAYYLRIHAHNRPGVLAQVATVLAEHDISIEALVQKEAAAAADVPIVLLLHRCREGDLDAALARIQALPVVTRPVLRLRVEGLGESA